MNSIIQAHIDRVYSYLPKFMYDFIMNWVDMRNSRKQLIEDLGFMDSDRVLEVACGTGLNFRYYPVGPEFHALDINKKMLKKAKRRDKNVRLYRGDAHALPFADGSFDIAIMTLGIIIVPDSRLAYSEMERVVCDGGRIGLMDIDDKQFYKNLGVRPHLQDIVSGSEIISHKKSSLFHGDGKKSEYIIKVNK